MRDLMIFGAMLFFVPLALRNAFAAYLLWGWSAFIAIDQYLFGFMAGMRFNLVFALVALGMLLVNSSRLDGRWSMNRTTVLLLLWLLQGTLSAVFAYPGLKANWMLYENLVKILFFSLLMPLVVVGRYRIHAMVLVLCLGLAFHALLDGLKFMASGGGHIVVGLSKFGDNNHFAVIILMVVPLLLYLYRHSDHRLVRLATLCAAVLALAAVIGTHSRGGLLAMMAGGVWLILTGRKRVLGVSLVAGLIVVIGLFAPSSWLERMNTIKSADQDLSFMARVEAWQVSSSIALHNPILGAGFHAVQHQPVWERFRGNTGLLGFIPAPADPAQTFRAAHSIYFETMADLGLLGFLLFIAILANIFLTSRETQRLALSLGPSMVWAVDLSRAFSGLTVIFMVGGAGVSIAYSEALYVVAMLAELLKQHVLVQAGQNQAFSQSPGHTRS